MTSRIVRQVIKPRVTYVYDEDEDGFQPFPSRVNHKTPNEKREDKVTPQPSLNITVASTSPEEMKTYLQYVRQLYDHAKEHKHLYPSVNFDKLRLELESAERTAV